MYIPKHFENTDAKQIDEFIRQNSFATLVTQGEDKPLASHIPLELSEDGKRLHGHVARANQQWKTFNSTDEALVIFTGPHTYVSSSWYDHENVSTWNYVAVHVYGTIRIIEGDELYNALKKLTDKYEKNSERPVSVEKMPSEYVNNSVRGIVGFEITIKAVQATSKLSQNRNEKSYQNIIKELEKRGDQANQIAELMKRNRKL